MAEKTFKQLTNFSIGHNDPWMVVKNTFYKIFQVKKYIIYMTFLHV
jgi:hypothetical protein